LVIVTMFDGPYLPGFLALLQSLSEAEQTPSVSGVIAYNDSPVRPSGLRLRKAYGFDVEYRSRSELAQIEVAPSSVMRPKNLAKLALFGIPSEDKVVYFDCDMLFLGNDLAAVAKLQHFSAAPNWGRREPEEVGGRQMFNSGFMLYEPSRDLLANIVAFARTSERDFPYGDQGILNYYFHLRAPQEVTYLDLRWNTMITLQNRFPEKYAAIEPQVLHFTGIKPWSNVRQRPTGGRNHPRYEREVGLWWSVYRRAVSALLTGRPARSK
jgi:hypothetical protein